MYDSGSKTQVRNNARVTLWVSLGAASTWLQYERAKHVLWVPIISSYLYVKHTTEKKNICHLAKAKVEWWYHKISKKWINIWNRKIVIKCGGIALLISCLLSTELKRKVKNKLEIKSVNWQKGKAVSTIPVKHDRTAYTQWKWENTMLSVTSVGARGQISTPLYFNTF
jgi:hypothetical protein